MPRPSGAWLLIAALVAACEPTLAVIPGRTVIAAVPVATASAEPSAAAAAVAPAIIESTPYAGPWVSATAAPGTPASLAPGAASPAVSGSLAPPPGYPNVVRLRGRLFDEGGTPIGGASVRVRALHYDLWYDRTVTTGADGAYQLEDVASNVNMEITAHRDGFTERRRIAALPPRPDWHTIDFGAAPGMATDAEVTPGAPHYLSNRPEIVLVSPDEDETLSPGGEVAFVLEVSEPLDDVNRDRLAASLRLMPASAAAVPAGRTGGAPDLRDAGRDDVDVDGPSGDLAWAIRPGTRFPADVGPPASTAWRGATRLRFHVPAVLVASATDDVRYQLGLVTPPDGARIEDAAYHQLGTDAVGDLNGYPPPGQLIRHVFLDADFEDAWEDHDVDDDPRDRWAATHRDAVVAALARDVRAPGLAGIDAGRVEADAAITLIFDEPMVAYDGSATGHRGPGLAATTDGALAFTFAVAQSEAELAGVALDGAVDGEGSVVDARAATYLGVETFGRELAFVAESARATREGAPPGSVVVVPDPTDARRVRLLVVGRPFFFKYAGAIKVRVTGFGDPAGNLRGTAQADAEVRTRPLPTPTPS